MIIALLMVGTLLLTALYFLPLILWLLFPILRTVVTQDSLFLALVLTAIFALMQIVTLSIQTLAIIHV